MTTRLLLLSLLPLVATPALGGELDEVAALRGERYLEARRSLAAEALRDRAAQAAWSSSSWRADLVAAAALAASGRPTAEARLSSLEGLDPARYGMRRRPEPEVLRELRHLVRQGEVPAPLVAEAVFFAFDAYAPGGEGASRAEERAALRDGLLLVLGETGHPAAPHVLATILLDEGEPMQHRQVAATALGRTRSEQATRVLAHLALKATVDPALREAATLGLGQTRRADAAEVILSLVRDPGATGLRVAALRALGQVGSKSAHRALRTADAERLRAEVASGLVEALPLVEGAKEEAALVEALQAVAHPEALAALRSLVEVPAAHPKARRLAEAAERRLARSLARR